MKEGLPSDEELYKLQKGIALTHQELVQHFQAQRIYPASVAELLRREMAHLGIKIQDYSDQLSEQEASLAAI